MGEIADDCVDGACCSDCTTYFVKAHGYPVVCQYCAKSYSRKELREQGKQIAHIKEA